MEPQNNNGIKNQAMHTLAEDMVQALQKNEGGVVKKIIEEEAKKEEDKKRIAAYTIKNRIYIIFAIFLLLLGGAAVFFVVIKENPVTFFSKKRFTPLIFHEATKILDITNQNKDALAKTLNTTFLGINTPPDEIYGVYLTEKNKTINFNRFLVLIESPFLPEADFFESNFLLGAIKHKNEISNTEVANLEQAEENLNKNTKVLLDDFVTFSANEFFQPGTTSFIDENAKNKMKELLGYFLDTITPELTKINVFGIYSKENAVNKNVESYKNFGLQILDEVIKDKYKEVVPNFSIESSVKGIELPDLYSEAELSKISPADKTTLISLNNGIQFMSSSKVIIDNSEDTTVTNTSKPIPKKEVVSLYSDNTDVFLLFKVNKIKDVFSQVRIWENKMFSDLHDIFGVPLSIDTSYLLTKNFEDSIVQNKNARVLLDNTGKIVLMYVYIDESHIVITNTERTAKEILFRVNSSRVKK